MHEYLNPTYYEYPKSTPADKLVWKKQPIAPKYIGEWDAFGDRLIIVYLTQWPSWYRRTLCRIFLRSEFTKYPKEEKKTNGMMSKFKKHSSTRS